MERYKLDYTIKTLPSEGRMTDEWITYVGNLISSRDDTVYVSGNNCGGFSYLFINYGVVFQIYDPYSKNKLKTDGPLQLIGKEERIKRVRKELELLLNEKFIEVN